MTSIPVVVFPTLASLVLQTSQTNLIFLWLLSTLLAQDSVWMHLQYFTLLLASSSSFTIDACSILSLHQIACGIWTALVWKQFVSSPLVFYIQIGSVVITSLSLRFLPFAKYGSRSAIQPALSTYYDANHSSIAASFLHTPWYDWTASQVQEWVQTVIPAADFETFRLFRQHEIQGIDLPMLGLTEYRSMGLRLGVACRLVRAVENLQRQDSSATRSAQQSSSALGWLEQIDRQQLQDTKAGATSATQPLDEQGLPISTDALNAIFHERIGISVELPVVSSHHSEGLVQRKTLGKTDRALPAMHINDNGLRTDIPLVQNGVPLTADEPDLSLLPPHISSIYQRKPNLVQQMLVARQQNTRNEEEQRALLLQTEQQEDLDSENGYQTKIRE